MRNLISKLRFEKLRAAFGGASDDTKATVEKGQVVEVQEAIALLEGLVCETIAQCSGRRVGDSLSDREKRDASFGPSQNAFGRQLNCLEADTTSAAVANAAGVTAAGLRAAAFVSGDHLSEAFSQLQAAANRHLPLVVHAGFRESSHAGSSHAGYHGAADLGLFQVLPHTLQQAIDFSLLARWLAERALIPGLVGFDRHLVAKAVVPKGDLIRKFLGYSDDEIPSPSPAQLLLFGEKRPLVPRWFDLDRPISFSSLQGSNDGASAAVGRQAFFWNHLNELAEEGMRKLSSLTGRDLSFVSEHQLDNADQVIVVQGSAFLTAKAVAHYLLAKQGLKVGVLGVTWLRPFPSEAVRRALTGKSGVLVLECASAPLADSSPLLRELRNCVPQSRAKWVTATYGMCGQPLNFGQVVELVNELKGKNPRPKAWLGVTVSGKGGGNFPKREGLVRAVSSDYKEIKATTVEATPPWLSQDTGLQSIQWVGPARVGLSNALTRCAEVCSEVGLGGAQGFGWAPEPGVLSVRVGNFSAETGFAEAGTGIDVLLLGRLGLDLIYNPLADLKPGGTILIETERSEIEVWSLLPDFWRSEIKRLGAKLFRVEGGFESLVAAGKAVLSGQPCSDCVEIGWKELADPDVDADQIPQLVRRVQEAGSAYDNLPRFWGEVMQPKRGGISDNFPDPLVTVGCVPPCTAALARPRGTALPHLPVLMAERCTGCGECWPVCPDSAIGVTLLSVQELLDSSAGVAGIEGKAAGTVRRAHKPIAAKVAAELQGKSLRVVTPELLMEVYQSVSGKIGIPEAEAQEHEDAFKATVDVACTLSPVASESLFLSSEAAQKGSGKLLLLTINPDACQGCRLCISSCPEAALVPTDREGPAREDARNAWKVWEQLPDTAGDLVASLSEKGALGRLSALLLSRHSSQAQAVGSFGEPGSGERLAARLVSAVVEAHSQVWANRMAARSSELAQAMRAQVKGLLSEGLDAADPDAVEAALSELPRHRASLSDLTERLAKFGNSVSLDPVKTLRLTQLAHQLEDENWKLIEGVHGLGRSRFGVAVVSERVALWAGRFPNHPYQAPLIVDPSTGSLSLVRGLVQALALKHIERIRLHRRAALWQENPSDLPARLLEVDSLRWDDLAEEERQSCPPVLVFLDETALSQQTVGDLTKLLKSLLPVKFVLFDSRGAGTGRVDPTLFALEQQSAFVLSGSLAYPAHFAEGLERAIEFAGPAFVHLYAPNPAEHGFSSSSTLDQARVAVEARVHPLLTFDPSIEGVFGVKLSLDGNPDGVAWGGSSVADWAFAEGRFAGYFSRLSNGAKTVPFDEFLGLDSSSREGVVPAVKKAETEENFGVSLSLVELAEERLGLWKTYCEIAGKGSPFVDRTREELRKEIEASQAAGIEAMKRDYEARIAAIQREFNEKMSSKLRERLLTMAGFASNVSQPGN